MRAHLINTIAHANDPAPVTDMGGPLPEISTPPTPDHTTAQAITHVTAETTSHIKAAATPNKHECTPPPPSSHLTHLHPTGGKEGQHPHRMTTTTVHGTYENSRYAPPERTLTNAHHDEHQRTISWPGTAFRVCTGRVNATTNVRHVTRGAH